MLFECERRDVRGEQGQLEATSIAWNEACPMIEYFAKFVGLSAMTAWVYFGIVGFATGDIKAWGLSAAAFIVGIVFMALSQVRWRRNLVFHRDGTLHAPHGTPNCAGRFICIHEHTQIVSIEAASFSTQDHVDEGVLAFMRNGDRLLVADKLVKWEAHKLAVQLTLALQDMRIALASDVKRSGANSTASGSTFEGLQRTFSRIN